VKTYTVTKREGELLGPFDPKFDWSTLQVSASSIEKSKETIRLLESGGKFQVTTDGGWPRIGWHEVIAFGMYDGWPFWRPVPFVCVSGPLGAEWYSVHSITGIERIFEK
jgi:hypothetical protein